MLLDELSDPSLIKILQLKQPVFTTDTMELDKFKF